MVYATGEDSKYLSISHHLKDTRDTGRTPKRNADFTESKFSSKMKTLENSPKGSKLHIIPESWQIR
jgi:hypothetical protein